MVKNLNILKYVEFDVKIFAIQSNSEKETFCFSEVNIEDMKKGILKLDKK